MSIANAAFSRRALIASAVAAAAATAGVSGCSTASEGAGSSAGSNAGSRTLVVGMELAYPPFETRDDAGEPTGVSVTFMRDFAEE